MPTGSIYEHDDKEISEVVGDLSQENVHHIGVRIRQDEACHAPQLSTDRCVSVHVFPHDLPGSFGTQTLRRSSGLRINNSAETPLVLRHGQYWS